MSNAATNIKVASRVFKALSNPHRLTIFLRLVGCLGMGERIDTNDEGITQCQITMAQTLGLAPSTISHHYKELRDAGLIRMERRGKSVRFWIDPETIELVKGMLDLTQACLATHGD